MPSVLHNTQFLKLWGNQVLLQIAFNMCNYTALLIIANTTHSPFAQSQFYAAMMIPGALLGIIAGPIVDISDRKKLMLTTDALLGLFFLSYAFVTPNVYAMMAIAFCSAIVASFFTPAEAATIPSIVKEEELHHANSFFLFTLMGSVLLGYAIAGPIIQLFGGLSGKGSIAPFYVSFILLIICFLLRYSLHHIQTEKPQLPSGALFIKPLKLFLHTVAAIKSSPRIYIPLILLIFVEFIIGVMSVLFLEYVRRYLQLPLESISYVLIIPLVIGLGCGVALLGKVEKRYGYRLPIFTALFGIGTTLFFLGMFPHLISLMLLRVYVALAAFEAGICLVFIAVQSRTLLQKNTHYQMHGRVFSFLGAMTAMVTPLPILILGFVAGKISLLGTLALLGCIIVAVTIVANRFYYKVK